MSRRNFQRLTRTSTAALAAVALWSTVIPAASAQEASITFNIAGITDLHGHIARVVGTDGKIVDPGAGALACMLPVAAEGKNQLFVSSGDNIGGSAFASALLKDEPTIKVLNEMGLATSAVGNHEFDQGYADLAGRVADLAEFNYTGANVDGENPALPPYEIKTIDGVNVAFVGTVTATTADKVSPAGIQGITFEDPWTVTNKTATELKQSGKADVVVALFHEGYSTADQFNNDVDIVLAGDSHETVQGDVITRTDGSKFVLTQAGYYGKGLADLDVTVDPKTKKVTDIKSRVIEAEEIDAECGATPVASVQAIVDQAAKDAAVKGQEVVATVGDTFYRGSDDGTVEQSGSNRGVESTLSNMLAEAAKQGIAANTTVKPDLGVMNAGGVRADLEKGDVSYEEAFAVQPFGNEITYGTFTGAKIVEILEQQWKPGESRPILHLGWSDNMTYTYDPDAEQGKRITSVSIDGKPLDLTRTYVIAASSFLLDGGDGFGALKAESYPNTGLMDVDMLVDYLKANKGAQPRSGQSNVGVHFETTPTAGKPVKIDLSSLIYSIGDTATTVTVKVGKETTTAPIEKVFDKGLPGAGKASIELTMPEAGTNPVDLIITTDAGTEIHMPVTVDGLKTPEKPSTGGSTGSSGSSAGSSLGLGAAFIGVFGIAAAIIGAIQQFNPAMIDNFLNMLPAQIRDAIKPLLNR